MPIKALGMVPFIALGEFLALAVSFEDLGLKTGNARAKLLAKTLDAATGQPTLAPAYIDDLSLLDCLNAILKSPPIKARLTLGPQLLAGGAGRRELAEAAREVVTHLAAGEGGANAATGRS